MNIDAMRCEDCGGKPEVFAPGHATVRRRGKQLVVTTPDRAWCLR